MFPNDIQVFLAKLPGLCCTVLVMRPYAYVSSQYRTWKRANAYMYAAPYASTRMQVRDTVCVRHSNYLICKQTENLSLSPYIYIYSTQT